MGYRNMLAGPPCWLFVGLVTVAALGCVSTHEATRSIGSGDIAPLAGTWQGTASGAQGLSQPATLVLNTDGTFTMTGGTGGVFMSQGTAQVKDGRIILTSRSTSGGQTADRVTTAVLSERTEPSQVVQVLTGSGTSAAGPYSFSVSKPKE
jgi:hypothetical protein